MKIFAIRDEKAEVEKDLAYLLYYEKEKKFYIELQANADPWEVPILIDSFARRGETSINSYWSKLWVQQRIIPAERQNIGEILRDNHMDEYDEYAMLMMAMGRCAQDDYYLAPRREADLPAEIIRRFERKIEDVLPLNDNCLLVFFRDGAVKKCDMGKYLADEPNYAPVLAKREYFNQVQMQTGGHGISWDVNMEVPDAELYRIGRKVPLTAEDFKSFVQQRVVNAAEAAEILNCSRQNIDYLTKHGKLHPLKTTEKNTLYLKSEIVKRNWNSEKARVKIPAKLDEKHEKALKYAIKIIEKSPLAAGCEGLILYGSTARGEAEIGSDVDLLLVLNENLKGSRETEQEIRKLKGMVSSDDYTLPEADLHIAYGQEWKTSEKAYYKNIRRDGIALWS